MNKFYDILSGTNHHIVCLNGHPIARFDHLHQAESLRDSLTRHQAQLIESQFDLLTD